MVLAIDSGVLRSDQRVFQDVGAWTKRGSASTDEGVWIVSLALVHRIEATILERCMSQTQAAEVLGVIQSDLSKVLRGTFQSISIEKLFIMLVRLGEVVTSKNRPEGRSCWLCLGRV